MERILRINAPSVVSEIIDGEAVIMNLASGHYFSAQHVGCDIWRAIERQQSRSAIVRSLGHLYDVETSALQHFVDTFVADLLARDLVIEADWDDSVTPPRQEPQGTPAGPRTTFSPPVLNVYADMQDLLLLDPIHDVDEQGWPAPKPPATDER